ncbi:hypothetical protein G5V59_09945 [Nocardioides sp. W3-2-3]|uniref:hypothetical protein n=1 Tax=Nocardioides convexus TaxID=2712224 RepID=UPI0024182906|nr:hypothetical protein [Nocardioides convexus]NHA00322.1 hypothetical protein [Nocardioides convexus]
MQPDPGQRGRVQRRRRRAGLGRAWSTSRPVTSTWPAGSSRTARTRTRRRCRRRASYRPVVTWSSTPSPAWAARTRCGSSTRVGRLIDSYAWTAHATQTYGRCKDGVGTFVDNVAPTPGAVNSCPGLDTQAWPGSPTVRTADLAETFNQDASGLVLDPADPGVLWVAQNKAGTLNKARPGRRRLRACGGLADRAQPEVPRRHRLARHRGHHLRPGRRGLPRRRARQRGQRRQQEHRAALRAGHVDERHRRVGAQRLAAQPRREPRARGHHLDPRQRARGRRPEGPEHHAGLRPRALPGARHRPLRRRRGGHRPALRPRARPDRRGAGERAPRRHDRPADSRPTPARPG